MTWGKPTRVLLRSLLLLAVLSAFVVLDWYPALKELGRLRRERSDLQRQAKEYSAMAAVFDFPDAREKLGLAQAKIQLRRALPQVERDDAWEKIVLEDLRARAGEGRIPAARVLFGPKDPGIEIGTAGPGPGLLAGWLIPGQSAALAAGFALAADPGRYPWHGVLTGLEIRRGQCLAGRPLAVALAAPLPALLNFVNRVSWGRARLEIVRLRLEPRPGFSRAWLVCRGNYLTQLPSAFVVAGEPAGAGASLLIDPDSPLLWKKVAPGMYRPDEKKDLPPFASERGEAAPSKRGEAAGSPW
jgi:hypothetical protein